MKLNAIVLYCSATRLRIMESSIIPKHPKLCSYSFANLLYLGIAMLILVPTATFADDTVATDAQFEKATFAGGCFWCMQPFFDRIKGVQKTEVGYTGGQAVNPTYEEVSSGKTGHAESIQIIYDPKLVSYDQLLNIYWRNIDPTAVDSQFVDHGTQYRSAIFYHNEEQKRVAEESKKKLEASGRFDKPIETKIVGATTFYPAEEYHQSYYKKKSLQYNMYHDNSGREGFFKKFWGKE